MLARQGNGPDGGVVVDGNTYTWNKVGANISTPRPQTLADLNTLVFDIPYLQVSPSASPHPIEALCIVVADIPLTQPPAETLNRPRPASYATPPSSYSTSCELAPATHRTRSN